MQRFFFITLMYLASIFLLEQTSYSDLVDSDSLLLEEKKNLEEINKKNNTSNLNLDKQSVSKESKVSTKPYVNPKTPKNANEKEPILFSGKNLFGDKNANFLELKQDVFVRRSDFSLKSHQARIFFKSGSDNEVERVFAEGDVRMEKFDEKRQEKIKSFSETAEYFTAQELVILKGKPKLIRGKDTVKGKIIKYEPKTGIVTIEEVSGVVDAKNSK